MVQRIRRLRNEAGGRRAFLLAILALVAAGASFSVPAGTPRQGAREIVLEARGMAFYLPGDPTPNPTLRLAPGELALLTLVNRDRGMTHDLQAETAALRVPPLRRTDASRTVMFRAPPEPGVHDYVCTLHPLLMRGTLEVGPGAQLPTEPQRR